MKPVDTIWPEEWISALACILRQKVEASPNGIIAISMPESAALWRLHQTEATSLLEEAAGLAALAIGVVDATTIDVMTPERALVILRDDVEVGDLTWHRKPSPL